MTIEAVQRFKIGRKRKVDNALNLKRRNIFGAKTNCETASIDPNINLDAWFGGGILLLANSGHLFESTYTRPHYEQRD